MPPETDTIPKSQRYHILCEFFAQANTERAVAEINRLTAENPSWGWKPQIGKRMVYDIIRREVRRREEPIIRLFAPLDERLASDIALAFQLQREQFRVVDVRGREARQAIADTAADAILELIREVARAKPGRAVHLGFAGGDLVSSVARSLAQLLAHEPGLPKLALHPLTAGFDPGRPHTDPNTFFAYFENAPTEKIYHNIYSNPFVSVKGYREVLNSEGVRASYKARSEIDIVVTGMGSAEDPHSQLRRFYASAGARRPDPHWIGEVGWLPFGASGPAPQPGPIRGVALFQLHELVELARTRGKYCVLVAGSCGECGRPKGAALRPLVSEPALRCWTHLVLELDSAQELATRPAPEPKRAARRARKAAHRKEAVSGRA